MLLTLLLLAQAPALQPERRIPIADVLNGADGRPLSIAVAPDGMIALSQRSPAAVVLLDASGKLLRKIGREGEGPGEYRTAFVAFHHDTLIVADGNLRRVVLFDRRTGVVIRQFPVPSGGATTVDAAGRLYLLAMNSTFLRGGAGVGLLRFRLDGRLLDTVITTAPAAPVPPPEPYWKVRRPEGGGFDVPIPYQPRLFYAVAPEGGILAGWSAAPRVDHTAATGRTTTRWRGTAVARAISADVRRAVRDSILKDDARTAPIETLRAIYKLEDIPDRYPAFSRMDADGAGRIWLQRPDAPRDVARFDVVSAKGVLLGEATMPAAKLGRLRAWSATQLVTITEDDEGSWIEVYRIR